MCVFPCLFHVCGSKIHTVECTLPCLGVGARADNTFRSGFAEAALLFQGKLQGDAAREDGPGDGWQVANSSCRKDPPCLWSQDETILWN